MMIKKIVLILYIFLSVAMPSIAEQIPVKIAPLQVISTKHDEIEIGDWIKFEIVNDVYVNDKLYLKKNTIVIGVVDFVHQNGWGGDSADITFKTFYTTDVNNQKVTISYPLDVNGNLEMANNARDCAAYTAGKVAQYVNYVASHAAYVPFIFRGSEIFIEPDNRTFNLFINR